MASARRSAPAHIEPDPHPGRWWRLGVPAGSRVITTTAGALAATAEGELLLWESSGHTRSGSPIFVRSRFAPAVDGSLHGYDSSGCKRDIYPPDRVLHILATEPQTREEILGHAP